MVKETGWKPEYIIWELPCAWFFLLIDFWPVYKPKDNDGEDRKDISEFSPSQLESLGMSYANNS